LIKDTRVIVPGKKVGNVKWEPYVGVIRTAWWIGTGEQLREGEL
jgi:hypothetical protein